MTLGWNILGILAWLILVLYLIFIVQNIRKRHLMMIVKDRSDLNGRLLCQTSQRFQFFYAVRSICLASLYFANPDLENKQVLSSKIEYQPLILTAGNKRSYYVTARSDNKKRLFKHILSIAMENKSNC